MAIKTTPRKTTGSLYRESICPKSTGRLSNYSLSRLRCVRESTPVDPRWENRHKRNFQTPNLVVQLARRRGPSQKMGRPREQRNGDAAKEPRLLSERDAR